MASLCAGVVRAKTRVRVRSGAEPSSSSRPLTAASAVEAMPTRRAMASAVATWSPVISTGTIPASSSASTARPAACARRVGDGDQPQHPQALLDDGVVGRTSAGGRHRPPRAPGSPARQGIVPAPRPRASTGVGVDQQPAVEHRLGAPLQSTRVPPSDIRWTVVIRRRWLSNGISATRGAGPPGRRGPGPACRRPTSSAASVGSPTAAQSPVRPRPAAARASLHRAAARSRRRRSGRSASPASPSSVSTGTDRGVTGAGDAWPRRPGSTATRPPCGPRSGCRSCRSR